MTAVQHLIQKVTHWQTIWPFPYISGGESVRYLYVPAGLGDTVAEAAVGPHGHWTSI